MKKLLSIALIVIILPILVLTGCSSSLPTLDTGYYFSSNVTCNVFNSSNTKSLTLNQITSTKYESNAYDAFSRYVITGDSAKLYHIYVEKITLYVVADSDAPYPLIINLSMTNVRSESEIGENLSGEYLQFTSSVENKISAHNPILYTFNVDRVFSSTTETTYIVFDILNSDIYNSSNDVTFRWQIYGLKIHGEARAYN